MIVLDLPRDWGVPFNQRYGPSAHLLSDLPGEDGSQELAGFVHRVGMGHHPVQHPGAYNEHYDVAGPWITLVRVGGARDIDRETLVAILRRKRAWLRDGGSTPQGSASTRTSPR